MSFDNRPLGNNYFSPEFDEPPQIELVAFEIPDFYGSNEDTIHAIVKVYVNNDYQNNEIEAAYIKEGNIHVDVYHFLTEEQKDYLRYTAKEELS
jgi:hypothetical protein